MDLRRRGWPAKREQSTARIDGYNIDHINQFSYRTKQYNTLLGRHYKGFRRRPKALLTVTVRITPIRNILHRIKF
jgi:hypothetical protein